MQDLIGHPPLSTTPSRGERGGLPCLWSSTSPRCLVVARDVTAVTGTTKHVYRIARKGGGYCAACHRALSLSIALCCTVKYTFPLPLPSPPHCLDQNGERGVPNGAAVSKIFSGTELRANKGMSTCMTPWRVLEWGLMYHLQLGRRCRMGHGKGANGYRDRRVIAGVPVV